MLKGAAKAKETANGAGRMYVVLLKAGNCLLTLDKWNMFGSAWTFKGRSHAFVKVFLSRPNPNKSE